MKPALHVSLNVSDVSRARDFYSAFLGLAPAKEKPGYVKFVTSEPELHLALNESGRRPDAGGSLSHPGIRVGSTDEVDRWKLRVTERGVASFEEKDTTCCYARQDKFWVSDPDGNRWEVYTVLEDVELATAAPSCCFAPEASGEGTAASAACC
jgi:catechol 2,3-dioxygenase-like lactoylglutathione lyase family enzyme